MSLSLRNTLQAIALFTTVLVGAGCPIQEGGTGCYWMQDHEPYAFQYAGWVTSYDECYALDSCDGGLGQSGGGCYKWADSADGERYPWPGQDTGVDTGADTGGDTGARVE